MSKSLSDFRVEVIGDCTLYNADMTDILPLIKIEGLAAVFDPPYGINIGGAKAIGGAGSITCATEYGKHEWDKDPFSIEEYDLLKRVCDEFIIWGANHFPDVVGKFSGVLIWDKKCQNGWNDTFSDAELAYCSTLSRAKVYRHLWVGALRKDSEKRFHPTQKPLALMDWCLDFVSPERTIIDPYFGSGTTGVACANRGLSFIGIERDENYFNTACTRIRDAYKQRDLFVPQPEIIKPEQGDLLSD